MFYLRPSMDQIERQKLIGGPGMHHGVLCRNIFQEGDEFVVNFDPRGITFLSVEEWAQGRPWKVNGSVPEDQLSQAVDRIRKIYAERQIYNLILNNCEHIATWIVKGERTSKQVGMVIFMGLFTVALVCILRSK